MKEALCFLGVLLHSFPAYGGDLPQTQAAAPEATPPRPLRLALTSTSAFGISHAGFFNQLLGARLDYRFDRRFAFGGSFSYANLEGRAGRAHNLLPEARLELELPLSSESFTLPLHFAAGYLPKNGPTLRLGAGFAFALSNRLSLELTPLEPMIWITRERPEVSLAASAAVRCAF
jgi:hypothetical protein